jgi:hypothetical protein
VYSSILVLGLLASQPGSAHEFLGKVESINKGTWCIGVRDTAANAKRMFYVQKRTRFTKDQLDSSFKDLRVGDVVALTWKMRHDPGEDRRIVETVDIRPTLWPDKLKVGQVGYMPPQNEKYYFVVEAVQDPQTVLIREIVYVPKEVDQTLHQHVPGYAGSLKVKVFDHIEYVKKDGEQFFLGKVAASDYPVSRKVQLDGKWYVKSSSSTDVTKAGPTVTTKIRGSGTQEREVQSETKREGQGDQESTVNGNTTETNVKGRSKVDQNVKQKVAGKGSSTTSVQREVTSQVSGFVLVPANTER